MTRAPLHLVDASVYVFRAYFALPDSLRDPQGRLVNAVYGWSRFLGDLIEAASPDELVIAFDESLNTSFRNDFYPEYKANRDLPPEDLVWQFARCREITEAFGVTGLAADRYEADDIIGTLAAAARTRGQPCVIVTRDKDLAQLLRPGDIYWDYAGKRRLAYEDIQKVYGVPPEAIADLLALTGDSVDNIPGVRGIGPKTAVALLGHFGDLESIYGRLDEVAAVPVRGARGLAAKLAEQRDIAFLSRRLTNIALDVPVPDDPTVLRRCPPDIARLTMLYEALGFGTGLLAQAHRVTQACGTALPRS